ncbi:MAG: chemotaxis protein CheW [Moorea sp. SIO1G6]|uniref:Chemotaxis protein CheW n=1 Tax=Moorena producens (strain JHB) TaxID=1454205 RepID=A0A1D9G6M2_MOOP1|nr:MULTISPECIES: chemotaxis protein CheW [Moorena]AOY83297.1 chemotaxis protein CheW [Moorena producens JHB]NET63072.1 chemotaxis protein CheW [Moorena sp. SIO1G6]
MVSKFVPALASPSSATETAANEIRQQFLRFHLVPDTTALMPINQLTEVLTIAVGQIIPIAHMPPWVMGVYNWRGEVLWMVDLGHIVGLTPWHQQPVNTSHYTSLVLHIQSHDPKSVKYNQMLGLVVNRVEDIEWCNPDLIQPLPSSSMNPELAKFLQGYWLKHGGEMLVVFDGKLIFDTKF